MLNKPGPHRTRQRCSGPVCDVRARPGPFRPVKTASRRAWGSDQLVTGCRRGRLDPVPAAAARPSRCSSSSAELLQLQHQRSCNGPHRPSVDLPLLITESKIQLPPSRMWRRLRISPQPQPPPDHQSPQSPPVTTSHHQSPHGRRR